MSYDVYCRKCGEPWGFLEVADNFGFGRRKDFYDGKGCPSCEWGAKAPDKAPFRSQVMGLLREMLGDDEDGIAAEMEDAEMMFGDKFWEEGE